MLHFIDHYTMTLWWASRSQKGCACHSGTSSTTTPGASSILTSRYTAPTCHASPQSVTDERCNYIEAQRTW